MKVLLVNGSPNENGCTATALNEISKTLNEEGIATEIFWIGNSPISGCIACRSCKDTGTCVISDKVNEFLDLAATADGFIFGSPVHYAALGGALTSFMDRVFFANSVGGKNRFYLKPAAGIISARRAGTTAAFDQINKYFTISQMPIISSMYWNMVHGSTPKDVLQDLEGLQTMRVLARNIAWFLRCIECAKVNNIEFPKTEKRIATNFIR